MKKKGTGRKREGVLKRQSRSIKSEETPPQSSPKRRGQIIKVGFDENYWGLLTVKAFQRQ